MWKRVHPEGMKYNNDNYKKQPFRVGQTAYGARLLCFNDFIVSTTIITLYIFIISSQPAAQAWPGLPFKNLLCSEKPFCFFLLPQKTRRFAYAMWVPRFFGDGGIFRQLWLINNIKQNVGKAASMDSLMKLNFYLDILCIVKLENNHSKLICSLKWFWSSLVLRSE